MKHLCHAFWHSWGSNLLRACGPCLPQWAWPLENGLLSRHHHFVSRDSLCYCHVCHLCLHLTTTLGLSPTLPWKQQWSSSEKKCSAPFSSAVLKNPTKGESSYFFKIRFPYLWFRVIAREKEEKVKGKVHSSSRWHTISTDERCPAHTVLPVRA